MPHGCVVWGGGVVDGKVKKVESISLSDYIAKKFQVFNKKVPNLNFTNQALL